MGDKLNEEKDDGFTGNVDDIRDVDGDVRGS